MSSGDFEIQSLVHLEQSFFDAGYADGLVHGRKHGLLEGRAMGREKGYALWEEIGFYEGFARVCAAIEAGAQNRVESHARHLLELVARFPRTNSQGGEDDALQVDTVALLSKIRARYKALCATLGIRPRLRPADDAAAIEAHKDVSEASIPIPNGNVWRLEGNGHGTNEVAL